MKSRIGGLLALSDKNLPPRDRIELLNYIAEALRIVPIPPVIPQEDDEERSKFKELFYRDNHDFVLKKIKSNELLKESFSRLFEVYMPNDSEYNSILSTTEYFIEKLIDLFLSFELDYLFHLKKCNYDNILIKGELLNLDLITGETKVNESLMNILLNNIIQIVCSFSFLLQMNNRKGLKAIISKHQELEWLRANVSSDQHEINDVNKIKSKLKIRPGRPGKFQTEEALHQAIFEIQDWGKLSVTALAKNLGYKGGSGLRELLKSKKWSMPNKLT
jgi:hypothetical protein